MRQERVLWSDISLQLIFGDSPRVPAARFTGSSVAARGEPSHAVLEVARGISTAHDCSEVTVTLAVKNAAEPPQRVKKVVLIDTVREAFDYVWASANVPVTGTNPYQFDVGDLEIAETKSVTYRIVPLRGAVEAGRQP